MEMNKKLLVKAKEAKSAEELMALAKENGVEMTEESANAYLDLLHPETDELSEEELNNVSGGGCKKGDETVVSALHSCSKWRCWSCGEKYRKSAIGKWCSKCGELAVCSQCIFNKYEKGLWLCTYGS